MEVGNFVARLRIGYGRELQVANSKSMCQTTEKLERVGVADSKFARQATKKLGRARVANLKFVLQATEKPGTISSLRGRNVVLLLQTALFSTALLLTALLLLETTLYGCSRLLYMAARDCSRWLLETALAVNAGTFLLCGSHNILHCDVASPLYYGNQGRC